MALQDLFRFARDNADLIGTGIDYFQNRENYDDASNALNQGYSTARDDIIRTQQPYQEFGLEHMQPYNDMGEFDFSFNDYLDSDYYDWLAKEGDKATMRFGASAPQGFLSGKTLADIGDRRQMMAAGEYGAEHGRQLAERESNLGYRQFPLGLGAETAQVMGGDLASLAIAQGGDRAALSMIKSDQNRRLLSNLFGSGDPSRTGSLIKQAAQKFLGGDPEGGTLIREILGPEAANLSDAQLNDIVGVIESVPNLAELGNMFSDLWSEGGMGIGTGADFLDSIGDWTGGDVGGMVPGGDIWSDPDQIFNYTPTQLDDLAQDQGFWDSFGRGLKSAWDATGGKVLDFFL